MCVVIIALYTNFIQVQILDSQNEATIENPRREMTRSEYFLWL